MIFEQTNSESAHNEPSACCVVFGPHPETNGIAESEATLSDLVVMTSQSSRLAIDTSSVTEPTTTLKNGAPVI